MADSEGLGDLIQGHLVQLFETFGKIVNAAMKKVQQQDLAQNQAHQAEIAAMDELLMKEQEIMQEAEEIQLDGQGLTACLQLVLWLEQQGVQEVMDVAQRVLAKSEEEVESWQSFELETGTQLRFMMTGLSFGLRKRFVQSYGEKINSIFRQYLSAYDWLNLPEPSDCKEQFFFICQLLAQANGDLNLLFEPVPRFQKLPTGKMTMKSLNSCSNPRSSTRWKSKSTASSPRNSPFSTSISTWAAATTSTDRRSSEISFTSRSSPSTSSYDSRSLTSMGSSKCRLTSTSSSKSWPTSCPPRGTPPCTDSSTKSLPAASRGV